MIPKFRVWDWRLKKFNFFDLTCVQGNLPMDCLDNVDSFTGVKDFWGNDIYGSDKIEYRQSLFNTNEEDFPIRKKVVKFLTEQGKWNIYETAAGESYLKVIGNIYQS
jgi:hypothetical protein